MIKAVESVSKKKYVKIWRNYLRINIGLKMFESWYDQVSVGLAMRKIIEVRAHHESCVSLMRLRSKLYYPAAICFQHYKRYLHH